MTKERDKLEKLLGMLGSAFDGERASAALLIHRMATSSKLTVVELIKREFGSSNNNMSWGGRTSGFRTFDFTDEPILSELRKLRVRVDLTPWERSFVANLLSRYDSDDELSPKQRQMAQSIIDKFEAGY